MRLHREPGTSYTSTDVLIFLILLSESCIVKEASDLEIFEVFSIDSLRHSKVGRTSDYGFCMFRVMVWIRLTSAKYIEDVGSGEVGEHSREEVIMSKVLRF